MAVHQLANGTTKTNKVLIADNGTAFLGNWHNKNHESFLLQTMAVHSLANGKTKTINVLIAENGNALIGKWHNNNHQSFDRGQWQCIPWQMALEKPSNL